VFGLAGGAGTDQEQPLSDSGTSREIHEKTHMGFYMRKLRRSYNPVLAEDVDFSWLKKKKKSGSSVWRWFALFLVVTAAALTVVAIGQLGIVPPPPG